MPRFRLDLARHLRLTPEWPGRVVVPPAPALVIVLDADDPPPIEGATELVVAADRPVIVHGSPVAERIPLRALRNPLRDRALAPRDAVIQGLESATLTPTWHAWRHGVKRFHFTHSVGASFGCPVLPALALAAWGSAATMVRRIGAMLGRPLGFAGWQLAPPPPTRRAVRRALAQAVRLDTPPAPSVIASESRAPRTIVHHIGHLGAGGAERQLGNLATAQARAGYAVTVVTARELEGDDAHYLPALLEGGVKVRTVHDLGARLPSLAPRPMLPPSLARDWPARLRVALDTHPARRAVLPLVAMLAREMPEVLHCWLDEPNSTGALAGLLARVPRVVLSTRNVNPRHFPNLNRTWFRASYRLAAHAPTVRLIANSQAGAIDYATWCGIDTRRFHVIPNGVELPPDIARAASDPLWRARKRAELCLTPEAFVVGGVFRLAPEKRPLDFVEVLARARARLPELRALHVGGGPDEQRVREQARALGLADTLIFLGRQREPAEWLAIADASLLTSEVEGCPNVVLESQALGVPVVLTRAGGAPEAVIDGVTGYVCEPGDLDAMAARLIELATQPALRGTMGTQGAAFVACRFSTAQMVEETCRLYA